MPQYDSKKYILSYAGQQVNIGVAPGTHIVAERVNDLVTPTVGSDGSYLMSVNNDRSGTVTLTLLATALMNAFLSARLQLTEKGAYGGAPLELIDLNAAPGAPTVLFSPEAWIIRPPNVTVSQDGSDAHREWVFGCGRLEMTLGGAL